MAEKTAKRLADQAQGRIISAHIDVTLTPPQATPGETDAALDCAHLLIDGALHLLQQAAERNGFRTDITVRMIVY